MRTGEGEVPRVAVDDEHSCCRHTPTEVGPGLGGSTLGEVGGEGRGGG